MESVCQELGVTMPFLLFFRQKAKSLYNKLLMK